MSRRGQEKEGIRFPNLVYFLQRMSVLVIVSPEDLAHSFLPQIICVTKRNKDDMYIKHTLGFGRRLGPTYVGTAPKRKKGKKKVNDDTKYSVLFCPPRRTESVNPSNPMTYHTKSKKEKTRLNVGRVAFVDGS